MKIDELTDEDLVKIAGKRPDWIADNRTDWMADNRRDWMADNRPEWMADNRPEWMIANRLEWMIDNRRRLSVRRWWIYPPEWMADNCPDWMVDNCPNWMIKNRPEWMSKNHPELINRPDIPNEIMEIIKNEENEIINRQVTPSDIEVLIWCHCSPEPHPRLKAPAVHEGLRMWSKKGMIEPYSGCPPGTFRTTDKGRAMVESIYNLANVDVAE